MPLAMLEEQTSDVIDLDIIDLDMMIPGSNITIRQFLTDEELALKNQQVIFSDPVRAFQYMAILREAVPLTSRKEIARLKNDIAKAAKGKAFVIQAGLCAETMDDKTPAMLREYAENMASMIHRIADTLEETMGLPIVRMIRGAGQFSKPRTVPKEKNGEWTYRGESVHTMEDRTPDPARMMQVYQFSKEMLEAMPKTEGKSIYAGHECLMLASEVAQHQGDYISSSPMLWIGNRTNELDGMHVNLFQDVENVVGVKIDGKASPEKIRGLASKLNKNKEGGKLIFIIRIGAEKIEEEAPPILETIAELIEEYGEESISVWGDALHGNVKTVKIPETGQEIKTRDMEDIIYETVTLIRLCARYGIRMSGTNIEMSPNPVTEVRGAGVTDLTLRRESTVDPCMNPEQGQFFAQEIGPVYRQYNKTPVLRLV